MSGLSRREMLGDVRRVYTKMGSSILKGWDGRLDEQQFYHFAMEVSSLYKEGIEFIHVTSGAIRTGMEKCGIDDSAYKGLSKRDALAFKQHLAGVGQYTLMERYEKAFKEFGLGVSQILLLSGNLKDPEQLSNLMNCYRMHRRFSTIPIINNNDCVSTDELGYSENDELLADIAITMERELPLGEGKSLVINLSEHCLHDKDPRNHKEAKPIYTVEKITEDMKNLSENSGPHGTGGMRAKLMAAERITGHGVLLVIADGKYKKGHEEIIVPILKGGEIGTIFIPAIKT